MMKRRKFKSSLNIFAFTGSEGLLSKTFKMVFIFAIIILVSTSIGGCATMDNGNQDLIRKISFSPDGKKILFDRRNAGGSYRIHVYDLEIGELAAYQSPVGEEWGHARYSLNGKNIVFTIMHEIGDKDDPANTQIAVMDVDGKNVRKITNTAGLKIYPSFSHSGRKILRPCGCHQKKRPHTGCGLRYI